MGSGRNEGSTMRRVAGVLYGVYALYQVYVSAYFFWGDWMAGESATFPPAIAAELLFALAAAVLGVWLWAGGRQLSPVFCRGVLAGTALLVVYELFMYNAHVYLITRQYEWLAYLSGHGYSFYYALLGWTGSAIAPLVIQLLRIVLLVLGAFFVMSTQPAPLLRASAGNKQQENAEGPAADAPAEKKEEKEKQIQKK